MLKALVLRSKIDSAKKALEALRAKDEEFNKREEEITQAIEEAAQMEEGEEKTEAQKAVEEEAEKFDSEKAAHEEEKQKLEDSITEMENDLAATEDSQNTEPQATPEERTNKGEKTIMKRNRFFRNVENLDAMFQRDDVKAYLAEVRSCIKNKRELTNVGLTIPEVFIGIIKENVEN